MNRRRDYGPWPFSPTPADRAPLPLNPWKVGDRVRYHPVIGQPDDGSEYVVRSIGHMISQPIAWLEGRRDYVASEQLTSAEAARAPSAADHLAEARVAWRDKCAAETTLARLGKYRGLTSGMKADRAAAAKRLRQAELVLKRILGGAA